MPPHLEQRWEKHPEEEERAVSLLWHLSSGTADAAQHCLCAAGPGVVVVYDDTLFPHHLLYAQNVCRTFNMNQGAGPEPGSSGTGSVQCLSL